MKGRTIVALVVLLSLPLAGMTASAAAPKSMLITVLSEEMDHSIENLAMPDGTKPYFMSYTITDTDRVSISAELGALTQDATNHNRLLDVDVRVGDYALDSTHKIRGGFRGFGRGGGGATRITLSGDPVALKQAVWLATDRVFKSGAKQYQRVQTNLKTMVDEEDKSDDFTKESPNVYGESEVKLTIDRKAWANRLRTVSKIARDHPLIYNSRVSLSANAQNIYFVNNEGSKIQHGQKYLRIFCQASTKAEDGMELSQAFSFSAALEGGLPSEETLVTEFKRVIEQVLALREAPLVEPYSGPAILMNRASAVFFHEIFGHRIEGHRQKDVDEGQTFTKKVGQEILPTFISVLDDPTLARFGDTDLRGYYKFDDEGVKAEEVTLVDNGVLKNFLMSRSPVQSFNKSNGHGRRQAGAQVVSRMGNTIIRSTKTTSFTKLREMLIEECVKQGKPYGLMFEDITGGFTGTRRSGAQSFKVLPVVVYRVFADGKPDELIRGVDIVGTPLTSFSKIIHTGDDPDVFNGTCGAESGSVPVSGVSPSILVSEIEVEKRRREQDKPPILSPPIAMKTN